MANFYDNLAPEDVAILDRLSRLLIDLREGRAALLARHAVGNEEDLLGKLRAGEIAEHSAYEDYLGAKIIESTRTAIRTRLRDYMLQTNPGSVDTSLHAQLSDAAVSRYGERMDGAPRQALDALILRFDGGLGVELRFAGADEYSMRWRWRDEQGCIDTAPLHARLSTFPNHLHVAESPPRPDPLTVPGRPPLENLCAVLDAILEDPRLAMRPAGA